jgi:hypothetical protein
MYLIIIDGEIKMKKIFAIGLFFISLLFISCGDFRNQNGPVNSTLSDLSTISIAIDAGSASKGITVTADKVVKVSIELTDPTGNKTAADWYPGNNPVLSFYDRKFGVNTITITEADDTGYAKSYSKDIAVLKGYNYKVTVTIGGDLKMVVDDGAENLTAVNPWSFAVMADTQWIGADDGKNPNSVAVDIINQLNREFIKRQVKFVVAVGDVTDNGSKLALDTRVTYVQALYNAGIGFFPLRGNHESSSAAAIEFQRIFPQTRTGMNNNTPDNAFVTTGDDPNTMPVAKTGSPFMLGSNFSSPSDNLAGLSYSFDYNNARFVLLDQFTPTDSATNTIDNQQSWISSVLGGKASGTHAFVFSHKGLITENHVDTLFGSNPSTDPSGQDAFISSLAGNGVRYHMFGHDHMYNRSIYKTTDNSSAGITEIICASDSSKFYIPAIPTNDTKYNVPAFGHTRQTPIFQELNTIGYYIVTVSGDNTTVEYYSAIANPVYSGGEYLLTSTPALNFTKQDVFGYGLKGREFIVPEGQTYTTITDTFYNTTARVLSGYNGSTSTDYSGRQPGKAVDTGWSFRTPALYSDIFSLWGMTSGSSRTDVYTLSMNYDYVIVSPSQVSSGLLGLATKDQNGNWVNAADKNSGGSKSFVVGPWNSGYSLGTYGIDSATHTAWAVINYSGDFSISRY